jgi:tetratricopeptide (TPR) repeat protein
VCDPKFVNALRYLCVMLLARDAHAEGAAVSRRLIELTPLDSEAHIMLGKMLLAQRALAGAEAAFRRALALDPAHATAQKALLCLGALKRQGNPVCAEAAIDPASGFAPLQQQPRRFALGGRAGQDGAGGGAVGVGAAPAPMPETAPEGEGWDGVGGAAPGGKGSEASSGGGGKKKKGKGKK